MENSKNTNISVSMKLHPISIDDIYEVSELLQIEYSQLLNDFIYNKKKNSGICLWRSENINKFLEGSCIYNENEIVEINCFNDLEKNYDYIIRNLPKTLNKIEVLENRVELIKALQKNKFKLKKTIQKNSQDYFLMEKN